MTSAHAVPTITHKLVTNTRQRNGGCAGGAAMRTATPDKERSQMAHEVGLQRLTRTLRETPM